jgi:L-alanine-DL-glutamate epimerase-like enolase superfamily enzyme
MRIAGVETRRYALPLDPPLEAAWDPEPRTRQEATLVIVHPDEGQPGYASGGDALPDRAALESRLVGLDPFRTEVVRELCATFDFHGARPWTVEVAVWDLVARALDLPLWRLLGGRRERLVAYASSGARVDDDERVARCAALRDAGWRAVKLRFAREDWRADVALAERVRDAAPELELLVDANHGWRMPGDLRPRWDVATAAQVARALEPLGVHWLEEPLDTADVDGYAALRRLTTLGIAAGEMARTEHEARDLVVRGGIDVLQTDVVLACGIGGCRRLAALAGLHGRAWSPHTWSNALGLLANMHAALAFSTHPYVEVPHDPPDWSPRRRDWLLPGPIGIADDGTIAPPPGPGLGVEPDLDALERYRVG